MHTSISIGELMRTGEAALQTGPFGTQLKADEYVDDGVPVINVRNVGFGDVRDDDLEFVTEAKAEQLQHHRLLPGDIVFGRKGAVERHGLITEAHEGWVQGSDCLRLRLRTKRVDVRYLSYFLRTKAHGDWMHALCSFGATMASLNQDIVSRISFPAPAIEEQRKIAAILAAYDDLIANNQRRIALLQGMAEEIYREWFVRMRFPGYESVRLKSGLPEGWAQRKLSEVAEVNARSVKKGSEPELVRYIDITAVGTNEVAVPDEIPYSLAPSRARRLVRSGDILWSSVRPGNRAYCLIFEVEENLVASTGFAVISPRREQPFTYLHQATTTQHFVDQMVAVAKGSAYPAAAFDDFARASLIWPTALLLSKYHAIAKPMYEQVHRLRRANAKLAQQRDALLPRLISGKLKVDHLDIRLPPSMCAEDEAAEATA